MVARAIPALALVLAFACASDQLDVPEESGPPGSGAPAAAIEYFPDGAIWTSPSWKAMVALHDMRALAFASGGVPSEYAAAMSTDPAASANSMVSVAEHIAKRNPPSDT